MKLWLLLATAAARGRHPHPHPCESLLVSGISGGKGAAAMGVYVHHEHRTHLGHRMFRHVGRSLWLYNNGTFGDDERWVVSRIVGASDVPSQSPYALVIGRGRWERPDFVRDDLLGEWDVDWQSGARGTGPSASRVVVRCVCETLTLSGLPREAPGREAMGVFDMRHDHRDHDRPAYERVGDRMVDRPRRPHVAGESAVRERQQWQQRSSTWLPPMALSFDALARDGAGAWQLGRYAHSFHVRALSAAGAPEAIFRADAGDGAAAEAHKARGEISGWEVNLKAVRLDAAAAGNAASLPANLREPAVQVSKHDVHIACACAGIRIGRAKRDDFGRAVGAPAGRHGATFLGATFIFTGSRFEGRRVYAAPLTIHSSSGSPTMGGMVLRPGGVVVREVFLWYSAATRQWLVGPEVGNHLVRFARVTSRAGLPELIGRGTEVR